MFISHAGAHPLPHARGVRFGITVPYDDAFLLLGGHMGGKENYDMIYKFDPSTEDWVLMPERMSEGKHGMAAFRVGPHEFPKCFE